MKNLLIKYLSYLKHLILPTVKIEPYFSVDLETTGLPEESCSIIMLSLVFNDGRGMPPREMPNITFFVDNEGEMIWGDYAKKLNKWIMDEIELHKTDPTAHVSYPILSLNAGRIVFKEFVKECLQNHADVTGDAYKKVSLAGKNAAVFDIPLLKTFGFDLGRFNHRVIDPGSMFYNDFGRVPSLNEIKEKYPEAFDKVGVSHDAYDDAIDVIMAGRAAKKL